MGVDLPLIKYVLTPLECFAAIKGNSSCVSNRCSYSKKKKKKKNGLRITTLLIANKEMKDMIMVKYHEESDLLIKMLTKTKQWKMVH